MRRLISLLLFTLALPPAHSAVWHVAGPYPSPTADGKSWATAFATIQQGLDAAQSGDEVWVSASTGPYVGAIHFSMPNVGLYGGFQGETQRNHRIAIWKTGLTTDTSGPILWIPASARGAVVDGFAISGALAGPGIRADADDVTLSSNEISHCDAGANLGGGIACSGARAVITDNWIHDNRASGGGGIYLRSDGARLERNRIQRNLADNQGRQDPYDGKGGGLVLLGTYPSVRDSVITGNTAIRYATSATPNTVPAEGGGLFCYGVFNLTNNTIADNTVIGTEGANGGGLAMASGGLVLAGNVFSGNTAKSTDGGAPAGGGGVSFPPKNGVTPPSVTFRSNYFHGNMPETGVPPDTDTRFGSAPQFVSATDYHLLPTSPLIDYGATTDTLSGERDADGGPRIIGPAADVGAYESPASPAPPTLTRAYVRPDGDDRADGSSWAKARQSVGSAISVTREGGEVWVAGGTYNGGVTLKPGMALYGGFAGTDDNDLERDARRYASVLDGGGRGTTVTIPKEAVSARVDGFTVRGGVALSGYGGGVYSVAPLAALVNCTVEDNLALGGGLPQYVSGAGGGAYMNGDGLVIANNIVRRNQVLSIGYGSNTGGGAEATGGGLAITSRFAMIVNNLITANEATAGGSFIYGHAVGAGLYPDLDAGIIANNTIVDNTAYAQVIGGFVVGSGSFDSPTVSNNVIAFNAGSPLTGSYWAFFSHNLVFGNTETAGQPSRVGVNGNIGADPLFADRAAGNYRLLPISPAIDAGDNGAASSAIDLDGLPRLQGARVDIGAYEFSPGGPLTVADAAAALRIAAGLSAATPELMGRLNVEAPANSRIDLLDAALLMRSALSAP